MPTGHFSIGDLAFSFEGSLKELAHCQEIIREIDRAERRLHRASGSERVVLIYDRNLEGERGTFDKMRLRAYDDERNYTLDIGSTDNNPLGIYVGYDQPIEVYDRESGETWRIDADGNRIDTSGSPSGTAPEDDPQDRRRDGPAAAGPDASGTEPPSSPDAPSASDTNGPSPAEIERAAATLRKRATQHPSDQRVADTTIPGGALVEKIRGFARYCGRDADYLRRVLDTQGVDAIGDLTVGHVPAVLDMIADADTLRRNENFEPDDDLPF